MTVTSSDAPRTPRGCANNATNPPVTLGTRNTALAPSNNPRATATIARMDSVIASGPRSPGAKRANAAAAPTEPTTAQAVYQPGADVVRSEHRAQPDRAARAEHGNHRAERGRDRVPLDDVLAGHHVWQRGRQSRV